MAAPRPVRRMEDAMSLTAILLIVALIVFIVDAFRVTTPVNLTAVGLAFLTAAFLVGAL